MTSINQSIILVIFFVAFTFAQTPRLVLLEEATNASCPPCAAYNPGLQEFYSKNFGGVISVRYHAWWPGSGDPMYVINQTDNETRINYYGINSVPNYCLDGIRYGVPSDPSAIKRNMDNKLKLLSPVKLQVSAEINEDSVKTSVILIALSDVTEEELFLRTTIIERMIAFGSAPGTNGEKKFADVMRQMLPDAQGIALNSIQAGDTLQFNLNVANNPEWNWLDLAVVAWLQSDDNKKIIQTGSNIPTFFLENLNDTYLDELIPNTKNNKLLRIINYNAVPLHIKLDMNNLQISDDWTCKFEVDGVEHDAVEEIIAPDDTLNINLAITTTGHGFVSCDLFAENLSDDGNYGYGFGYGFTGAYFGLLPGDSDVLLVDDDGGQFFENTFYNALAQFDVDFIPIKESDISILKSKTNLNQFNTIIWNVSRHSPAFTSNNIDLLKKQLDDGGHLILFGQDIGWDIFDTEGGSSYIWAMQFYNNYLDAKYVANVSNGKNFQGIEGDPISDGINFVLEQPYGRANQKPEAIISKSGSSKPIFYYENDKIGALRFVGSNYRVAYFGIGLEQIPEDQRTIILERSLEWVNSTTGISDAENPLPTEFLLQQNYPNPFNNTTKINYQLSTTSQVDLSIYNLLGQKIATLALEKQPVGTYKVQWDASGFASGVYLYKLSTDRSFSQTKKLILMK